MSDRTKADDGRPVFMYAKGMKLKHVAYNGAVVEIMERLKDGRFLIRREGARNTRVSSKTLDAEYTTDLNAPIRRKPRAS